MIVRFLIRSSPALALFLVLAAAPASALDSYDRDDARHGRHVSTRHGTTRHHGHDDHWRGGVRDRGYAGHQRHDGAYLYGSPGYSHRDRHHAYDHGHDAYRGYRHDRRGRHDTRHGYFGSGGHGHHDPHH